MADLAYDRFTFVVDLGENITANKLGNFFIDLEHYYELVATICLLAEDVQPGDGDPATATQQLLTFFFARIQARETSSSSLMTFNSVIADSLPERIQVPDQVRPIEIDSIVMASPLKGVGNALAKPFEILFQVLSPIERDRRSEEVRALRIKNDQAEMKRYYDELHLKVKSTDEVLKLRERLAKSNKLPQDLADQISDNLDRQLTNFGYSNVENDIRLLPAPGDNEPIDPTD